MKLKEFGKSEEDLKLIKELMVYQEALDADDFSEEEQFKTDEVQKQQSAPHFEDSESDESIDFI